MSLDLSQKSELAPLASVVRSLDGVAPVDAEYFMMGAAARDLLMHHVHNTPPSRITSDIDFAFMVADWPAFDALRAAMIASGQFEIRPANHRFRHRESRFPVDIVPFGGVERPDRTIAWPPDQTTIFNCFGAREALAACMDVVLPGGARLRVATIPALALLKITAWQDRKHTSPGRDAHDLLLFVRSYLDCGNLERATSEHTDLFSEPNFVGYREAGARLLARDIAAMLDLGGLNRLVDVLAAEADEEGPLLLASQSGFDLEESRRLIDALCNELAGC